MTTIRPATAHDAAAIAGIYNHYVEHTCITFDESPIDVAGQTAKIEGVLAAGLPWLVVTETVGAEATPGSEAKDEATDAGARETVLGYASVMPWKPKSAYRFSVENSIYLAPDARGRGLGPQLLTALLEAAAAVGIRQVIAVITDDSAASIALHRRFGFEDSGSLRDVGFKHGRWLGTVLMQKTLTAPPA